MAYKHIETPGIPSGTEQERLEQMYRYMVRLAEDMNINLDGIGSNDLTDEDRQVMRQIIRADAEEKAPGTELDRQMYEMESLKSLIIKTAKFVQTKLDEYRTNLVRETVAEGQFGKYVRNTGLDVVVNPEGVTQNYSFQEVVQGHQAYEVNAKNYIKSGLLRTVGAIPVYGVAIGKDIVTFSNQGVETYNDGNKVAELTADELSFYQNSTKIASYKAGKIAFLYGGSEVFYIENGKIYCADDLEIASGKKLKIASGAEMNILSGGNLNVKSGGKTTIESGGGLDVASGGNVNVKSGGNLNVESGGNLNVKSGGKTTIESGGGLDVASGGNVNVKSGGNLKVESGGNIDINATGNLKLSGSAVEIKSGSTFDVDATNFKIDSTNKKVTAGAWTLSENGLLGIIDSGTPGVQDLVFRIKSQNNTAAIGLIDSWGEYGSVEISNSVYDGIIITPEETGKGHLGYVHKRFKEAYINEINYSTMVQNSSRSIKHDIRPMPGMGGKLDALRPVTFVYNDDAEQKTRYGLIYEDTEPVMPEICTNDEAKKAIKYTELIPMLLKEIQDLRARVRTLEERAED